MLQILALHVLFICLLVPYLESYLKVRLTFISLFYLTHSYIFVSNVTTTSVNSQNVSTISNTTDDPNAASPPSASTSSIPVVNSLVTWQGDSAAGGYLLEYSLDVDQVWITATYTTSTRFQLKNLMIGSLCI